MNKWNGFVFLALFLLLSCERNNNCPVGPEGVYVYPTLPKGHSMNVQEVNQFLDIPQNVTNCISTAGLIESCLNYPFLSLIMAGSNPQTGYNLVSSQLRGLPELASRPDRRDQLLKKYQSIDPLGFAPQSELLDIGRYAFRIYYFEVILSQYKNLNGFSLNQKIDLVRAAQNVYQKKKKDSNAYSVLQLASTAALLARLMKTDNYEPFLKVYQSKNQNWDLVEWYWTTDLATEDLVYSLSADYLTFLTQKK